MKTIRLLLVALAALATGFAVDTHFWQHGDRADFESGTLKNLSLRADGRIFLSPEFTEIFDSSTPYLWTLAPDSKGNLYTAGGGTGSGTAKVFVIDRAGTRARPFAELDGLEIHAIVLDSKDEVYAATDPDGKIYKIGADGKPKLFYDPHQKYIWAMAFNSKGDLFVATGDSGEIHRVTPCRSRLRVLQDRGDPRALAGHRCTRQPDRRNRAERFDSARLAGRSGLCAVPIAQARDHRGCSHAGWRASTPPA